MSAAHSQTIGWFYSDPGSTAGYILFAPLSSDTTYLIDKCGKRVHTWYSAYHPGQAVYLLNDGTLLHTGNPTNSTFGNAGGKGGIIEELDWNSNVTWSYLISDNTECQHHDAIKLPNGNILAIVWENLTSTEAIDNGRNPSTLGTHMWSDKLVEIEPTGPTTGNIVWQWRAWDHLVQDYDSNKPNFGVIADHPELININIGQLNDMNADWLHCNGLDYNEALDQILVSTHNLSEVWIIDHSTTMEEAATPSGGLSGHGGDLLYRWGNPQNYGHGTSSDEKFYGQHNPHWIPDGFPGGGEIMVFNNGLNRPSGQYSTVETFTPPALVDHNYPIDSTGKYPPTAQDWIYEANPPSSFFSQIISSAQRLQNGNTIICEGTSGRFFEIDSVGNSLWQYINPVGANGITEQGGLPIINSVFRCVYLPEDYSGFAGHALTPGSPIELNPLNYSCTNLVGIDDLISEKKNADVFPDPFQNYFVIRFSSELNHASLQIHDITGRLIYGEKDFSASSGSDHSIALPNYHGMIIITVNDLQRNQIWKTTAVAQ
ncbi:MAG: aryl-sulfate sulfotransferase [Chitinophagales bacterium]